jgi:hypothetical protein
MTTVDPRRRPSNRVLPSGATLGHSFPTYSTKLPSTKRPSSLCQILGPMSNRFMNSSEIEPGNCCGVICSKFLTLCCRIALSWKTRRANLCDVADARRLGTAAKVVRRATGKRGTSASVASRCEPRVSRVKELLWRCVAFAGPL